MPEPEDEHSSSVQTIKQQQQEQGSLRMCEAIPRHGFNDDPVGDDDKLANNGGSGSNINGSTTIANDEIMNTPALSPPSSPKPGICPDKGLNRDEDDEDEDDDDDHDYGIFHYEQHLRPHHKHHHQGDQQSSESFARSYKIMAVDQEQLDHDKESINYFYRDFDADNNNSSNNNELEQQSTTTHTASSSSSSSSPASLDSDKEGNNSNNNKRQKQHQEHSIPTAAAAPFDLTAFAHQLYENRLSVVHSRESKLVLTEQDELEFAKLIEIRRKSLAAARHQQRQNQQQKLESEEESMAEEGYACEKIEWDEPIDILRKHQAHALPSKLIIAANTTSATTNHDDGATLIEPCQETTTTTPRSSSSSFSSSSPPTTVPSTPVSPKPTRSRGFSLQKLRNPIENSASWLPKKKLSRLSDNSVASSTSSASTSSFVSSASSSKTTATTSAAAPAANKQPNMYNDSDKILVEEEEDNNTGLSDDKKADGAGADEGHEQRSQHSSSGSRKSSNASRSSRFKELMDFDVGQEATDLVTKEPALAPSNFNNQHAPSNNQKQQKHQEPSNNQPTGPSRSMSLNLFGSLRNRARSQSTPSIKGLMRNFSTVSVIPQRSNTQPQLSQQLQDQQQQQVKKKRSQSGLSPAAIAVLKHNAESKKPGAAATTASNQDDKTQAATIENQSKGKRMLSQLLSSARISRRQVPKKVNMEEDAAATRAQIVRRTIIYVKPDSENFLKNIENTPAPVASIPSSRPDEVHQQQRRQRARSNTPDSDEDDASRQTATMITRQTSVKRQISKRRNNISNNNNDNNDDQQEEQQQTAQQELEGVEVREMSDGSVVWGVVKKQGKRKSFFAASDNVYESKFEINDPHAMQHKEEEEDEDQIEERVLALMGLRPDLLKDYPANNDKLPPPPIPKRSPHRVQQQQQQQQKQQHRSSEATHISSYANRRDSSTTDVYYAHGATLPSLLQMISDPAADEAPSRENPTVEEQLDEVMRSLGYTEGQIL